ncbi:MAG: glycoside hydrolase family 38 C-terminal domain-containing protein [Devosia sp.]
MNPLADKLGLLGDDIKREEKLARLCRDLSEKILTPLNAELGWHYSEEELSLADALAGDWRSWPEFGPRQVWSKKQGHTWLASEIVVPEAARGKTLVIRFTSQWQHRPGSTDPQCLAYLDGEVAQAIDGNHTELVVARNAEPGKTRTLVVNAFTFFDRPLVGFKAEYCIRNEPVEQLYHDLQTPLDVAARLPQNDARRHAILELVERALRTVDRRGQPDASSLAAAKIIADEIYSLTDFEKQPTVAAVGHTHLDVGWLWRVIHTRDKTGRSFATVMALMAEYPGFVFMYNQSVLFNFLKTDYPDIWEKVKESVRIGQFEIEGAMWVEPDVNIVSGESLVRQIMFGRRFHMTEFGIVPRCVWLPDTFGYSANLPQIMERSGLDFFITSKLSWNDTNRHPVDTFFWRGIDGTVTKAQLLTAQKFDSREIFTTYNSDLSVSEVMGAWKRYEPKAVNDEVLICYGYGDGGGGPTRAMIERGKRLERGIPGAPRLRLEGIGPFLERLDFRMTDNPGRFPTWNGELYLEYHRGTLSSVAKNKANNRRAERQMRELEFLATMATALDPKTSYPKAEIDTMWETVLINQFHDILPGTSINEVYRDSDLEYADLFSQLSSDNGIWRVAARSLLGAGAPALFNFTSHARSALVAVPGATAGMALQTGGGVARLLQSVVGADGSSALAAPVDNLPSLGWIGVRLVPATATETELTVSTGHLENAYIRVEFDTDGAVISVCDKASGRELIAAGQRANRLIAYEDKPLNWDAWDVDSYFHEQAWPIDAGRVEIVETGPWRVALRIERTYQKSTIVQIVSLEAGSHQLEFDTFVDWQERQTVLKAAFPFDLNSSEVRSEIQFGHVKRATHQNTSWDRARFEASMHRWVDVSEADFGAALLNDCKYGYDALEQQIRLTLLRGSIHPDPEADRGTHRFKYALFVHAGIADLEQVHLAAERFNNPVATIGDVTQTSGAATELFSLASSDSDCVTVETVKRSESGEGIVMRVFEHANRRTTTTIRFGVLIKGAFRTNLMEEGREVLEVTGNSLRLDLRPFEIATILLLTAR